jgi:hypothetical protein
MARDGKQRRNGSNGEATKKKARFQIPVPGTDATVTIAKAGGVDLQTGIDVIAVLMKEMKRAAEQQWSASTLEKACRDRTKRG